MLGVFVKTAGNLIFTATGALRYHKMLMSSVSGMLFVIKCNNILATGYITQKKLFVFCTIIFYYSHLHIINMYTEELPSVSYSHIVKL